MKHVISTFTVLAALTLSGCAAEAGGSSGPQINHAICRILGTVGNEKVKGVVYFIQEGANVRIKAEVEGLTPGLHGFHIHQWGDITCTDGVCAGGHFNPTNTPHGGPDMTVRHVGDLGNLKADSTGKATYDRLDTMVKLNGAHTCVGRAIIIHAEPDDLKTQPTGAAGARIAYGVIGVDDPEGK
ncbi:MAG: superoxide dismutase family protein [Planctomycetota bacterium]|jgi:Cu-Zn family superoxide dismutase